MTKKAPGVLTMTWTAATSMEAVLFNCVVIYLFIFSFLAVKFSTPLVKFLMGGMTLELMWLIAPVMES